MLHSLIKGMILGSVLFSHQTLCAQYRDYLDSQSTELVYKHLDSVNLKIKVWSPQPKKQGKKHPAIVFFFGGGWKHGDMRQFEPQAKYFASKGLVSITVDYRVAERNHTSPFDAVRDAKSAIRYIRVHSDLLNIDTAKIAAAGGSAGGHLAAASDLTSLDEANEDLRISSRPNAVILYNPVVNNGPGGYGYKVFGENYTKISPFHNIRRNAAPTLIMSGTKDTVVPVEVVESYTERMINEGNRCDIRLYEGQGHGFYRYNPEKDLTCYYSTLKDVEVFLQSLEFIK